MDPSERVIIKSREEDNVPAIPVIVAGDESGLPERVAELETEVGNLSSEMENKEDKKEWVRKLYKEITEETTNLISSDDNLSFNKAERIRIVITFQEAFNNNITATAIAVDQAPSINTFASGSQSSGVRTIIDFMDDPLITGTTGADRDTVTLQSFNTTSGLVTRDMLKLQTLETEDINTITLTLGAAISTGNVAVYALEPIAATQRRKRATKSKD